MAKETGKGYWRWTRLLGAALALVSIVLTGCDSDGNPFVVSLQPLYTQLDLDADSRLNGTWSDEEGDVTFSFEQGKEKGKEKEYKLVVKEKDGDKEVSGEFDARVVRLGVFWFLDIYPRSSKEGSDFYSVHFMRAHTIARLEIKQDSIQMAFLSASWLKAKIQEKSVDTPYVKADDALLLTGTTEEVQALVSCHANDDEAFADPLLLEKQRVEEEEQ
ncbi:MAG: hypothetical protein DMG41_17775 [Acidobacteria bacterium]|nr:MAG: hypothetical protein AUH13_12120 [Acidobacteria bacterium 13_2_20CM_58_27]PYT69766.1 MAG: hypothetical protein DMG42_20890 [Acidobacteriota bacterium]PYT86974.1 MAG: hypothetical protein DMG41_17775 [Acidobacteriota bacterium]